MFKKLLLSYSILFLFLGNILFSNIHLLYHHDHHHVHNHNHSVEYHECEECINIQNNNNFIYEADELSILNTIFLQFSFQDLITFDFSIKKTFLSRAPPSPKN